MELNWAPENRWQSEQPTPAEAAPWALKPSLAPTGAPSDSGVTDGGVVDGGGADGGGADGDEAARDDRPSEVVEKHPPPDDAGRQQPPLEAQPANRPDDGHRHQRSQLTWLRRVNFRSRISLLVGMAVGIAVALASLVCYVAVSHQLEGQVISNLQQAVALLTSSNGRFQIRLLPLGNGGYYVPPDELVGFQDRTGDVLQVISQKSYASELPGNKRFFPMSTGAEQALKENPAHTVPIFETLTASTGATYRVVSLPTNIPNLAVQIGYPLNDVDSTLAFLRVALTLVALGGVALAAGLGWAVGRASIRPVEDLTLAAEHVTATQDLSATIDEEGKDELARLAHSFNAMLAALSSSRDKQVQLVSDAGHELRTPLTSLRTNIEVLLRTKDLDGPDRDALLSDVDAQLQELTTLVGDLVDLARDDERPPADPESVAFDELVERAVERAHRRAMSVHFEVSLEPGQVRAQPALLERAVMNVLDNAAKWSPPGGRVWVKLEAIGAWHLTVTDEGPGIAPEDLPHVFERFYRAQTARSMPGSGLGLAIVKGVVTSHGGNISVTSPPNGGTRVEIVLPFDDSPSPLNSNGNGHVA
jgi:two-component system, OmpR family, sensor histidine kinase MprB